MSAPGSRALGLVLLLALVIRLGWVIGRGDSEQYADTVQYGHVAESIRAGRGVTVGGSADHSRPPAYPALIALVSLVAPRRLLWVLLVQAVISTLTVLVVHRAAARATGSDRAALAAALVCALDPFQVFFVRLALSETLYVFCLAVAVERAVADRPLAAGVAAGVGALARSIGLVHGLALAAGMAAVPGQPGKRRAAALALGVAGLVGCVAPWTVRNAQVHGAFVPVAIGSGFTLYESNNPLFSDGPWPPGLAVPEPPPGLSFLEKDRHWSGLAWAYIRSDPAEFARRAVRRQLRLFDPFPHAPGHATGTSAIVSFIFMMGLYAAALPGFFALSVRARVVLGAVVVATVGVHVFILGSVRYRLPLMPLFAVMAGGLVARLASGRESAG